MAPKLSSTDGYADIKLSRNFDFLAEATVLKIIGDSVPC